MIFSKRLIYQNNIGKENKEDEIQSSTERVASTNDSPAHKEDPDTPIEIKQGQASIKDQINQVLGAKASIVDQIDKLGNNWKKQLEILVKEQNKINREYTKNSNNPDIRSKLHKESQIIQAYLTAVTLLARLTEKNTNIVLPESNLQMINDTLNKLNSYQEKFKEQSQDLMASIISKYQALLIEYQNYFKFEISLNQTTSDFLANLSQKTNNKLSITKLIKDDDQVSLLADKILETFEKYHKIEFTNPETQERLRLNLIKSLQRKKGLISFHEIKKIITEIKNQESQQKVA